MNDMKKQVSDVNRVAEAESDVAKFIADYRAKEAAGLIEYPKRAYRECHSWREAWVYIFHRASIEHSYHLKSEGEKVTCVVWPVADFDDKLVDILGKISSRIGPNNDVVEMRLIETKVTPRGVENLKMILPKAAIKFFSREQAKKDQTIKYINTDIEWIKKLYAK